MTLKTPRKIKQISKDEKYTDFQQKEIELNTANVNKSIENVHFNDKK